MRLADDYYRCLVSGRARGVWPSLQRGGLWAASVPYGWAARLRNQLYDQGWKEVRRAAVPVVSVGNLTLGGTGKTPCVEYLADFYRRAGRRVAILSRGYGGHGGPNDEALVLAENLPGVPHLQGRDRAALAERAVAEHGCDLLLLDDGFQHRRLARDLDIVLIDGTQPWGHGYLFPRGLLREPRAGLGRAGVVALTRCDQAGPEQRARVRRTVARVAPDVPVVETVHRPVGLVNHERVTRPVGDLAGRSVAAFCGVGNPAAFRATLQALGFDVVAFRAFPDHHDYPAADVAELDEWARRLPSGCACITTQKDLVKLRRPDLGGRELWALRIRLHVESGQEALDRELRRVLVPGC